jgi:Cyclic nucleotide-binding domain
VLGRVFAVMESSYWITTGVGTMLAPPLVAVLGVRRALVVVGGLPPLCVIVRWTAPWRFEAGAVVPEQPFNALRRVSLFEPLPLATLENVSRVVSEVAVPAGSTVIREGDFGDGFYVVERGVLDVSSADGSFPPVSAGDFFGEIALLQDVPRTATLTARDDCLLYALDRESFLSAISSHGFASRTADDVASERLARVPLGG